MEIAIYTFCVMYSPGQTLADAALDAGFADQSHMTRQFGDAYGISPGRWLKLSRQANRG